MDYLAENLALRRLSTEFPEAVFFATIAAIMPLNWKSNSNLARKEGIINRSCHILFRRAGHFEVNS